MRGEHECHLYLMGSWKEPVDKYSKFSEVNELVLSAGMRAFGCSTGIVLTEINLLRPTPN